MPNIIDASGIQTMTYEELLAYYANAFQTIYGPDVDLSQGTPDGQFLQILIQSNLDLLEFVTSVYNSMNPDAAIGVVLDQRVLYNGIQRAGGTYTYTNVNVTVNQATTLTGLDDDPENPYTVQDDANNKYFLTETQSPSGAGTTAYEFRAENPGEVITTPNTITIPVTVVLGVVSVNNPSAATTVGVNEESDAALKIRRQKSVAIGSQGYRDGLIAALLSLSGVTYANVYENTTGSTDGDGVPGHSIWVVVKGGADADIANIIYIKRNAGCGMFGAETYIITQSDGSPFEIEWDFVDEEDIFIKFNATSIDGVNPPNTAAILAQLPNIYQLGIAETANINQVAAYVQQIDPNCLCTSIGLADNAIGPFTNTLETSAKNKQWIVDGANIAITVV